MDVADWLRALGLEQYEATFCQSARKKDPLSACKRDPFRYGWFEAIDVSLFGWRGPFLRPSLISPGRRAQSLLRDNLGEVRRSSSAVVILASPNTLGHSPNARFVVTITEVCS